MKTPNSCLSCGNMLGHVVFIFRRVRKERNKKRSKGVIPDYATVTSSNSAENEQDLADLLDKLGLRSDCCRMRMMTSMDMMDYY